MPLDNSMLAPTWRDGRGRTTADMMIALVPEAADLHVLLLGAHPDDIEIGCGGTLLTLADRPRTVNCPAQGPPVQG